MLTRTARLAAIRAALAADPAIVALLATLPEGTTAETAAYLLDQRYVGLPAAAQPDPAYRLGTFDSWSHCSDPACRCCGALALAATFDAFVNQLSSGRAHYATFLRRAADASDPLHYHTAHHALLYYVHNYVDSSLDAAAALAWVERRAQLHADEVARVTREAEERAQRERERRAAADASREARREAARRTVGCEDNRGGDDDEESNGCGDPECSECENETGCGAIDDRDAYASPDRSLRGSGAMLTDGRARLVGVEWEYNYSNDGARVAEWVARFGGSVHTDGSCGFEAVTPPMAGKHVASVLHALGDALLLARVDKRCGLHVHVDARDLQWTDMVRFLRVYALVEPILYAIGGDYRVRNQYCEPLGRALSRAFMAHGHTRQAVIDAVFDREAGNWIRDVHKKDQARYRGVNVVPWIAQRQRNAPDQTIEFRIHRNTRDPARVLGWVTICEQLVTWAATHNDRDVETLPTDAIKALALVAARSRAFVTQRLKAWRKATSRRRRNVRASVTSGKVVFSCAV